MLKPDAATRCSDSLQASVYHYDRTKFLAARGGWFLILGMLSVRNVITVPNKFISIQGFIRFPGKKGKLTESNATGRCSNDPMQEPNAEIPCSDCCGIMTKPNFPTLLLDAWFWFLVCRFSTILAQYEHNSIIRIICIISIIFSIQCSIICKIMRNATGRLLADDVDVFHFQLGCNCMLTVRNMITAPNAAHVGLGIYIPMCLHSARNAPPRPTCSPTRNRNNRELECLNRVQRASFPWKRDFTQQLIFQ